jgi:uncharacterized protein (TIGR02449 family)
MSASISSLERKVEQVVAFCEQLRAENHALRQRIAGLEQERETLLGRMGTARERLENIMERLPAE